MNYQKLTGLLSICRKAGKLTLGFAPVKEALAGGKVSLVLVTSDISPKTRKEVTFYCQKYHVPVCTVPLDMLTLGSAVGRRAAVAAVLDAGFSDSLQRLCGAAQTDGAEQAE